jgi:hypothetical protein
MDAMLNARCFAERQMRGDTQKRYGKSRVSMLSVAGMLQRYAVGDNGVVGSLPNATRNAMLKSGCLCRGVTGLQGSLRKLTRCRSRVLSVRVSLAETWTWNPFCWLGERCGSLSLRPSAHRSATDPCVSASA